MSIVYAFRYGRKIVINLRSDRTTYQNGQKEAKGERSLTIWSIIMRPQLNSQYLMRWQAWWCMLVTLVLQKGWHPWPHSELRAILSHKGLFPRLVGSLLPEVDSWKPCVGMKELAIHKLSRDLHKCTQSRHAHKCKKAGCSGT